MRLDEGPVLLLLKVVNISLESVVSNVLVPPFHLGVELEGGAKFHGEFVCIEAALVCSITEIGKGYRFLFREPRETCCLFRGTEER
jgi:hypothetical protein